MQDAILADPSRSSAVSVIDLRYWWYQENGELYAPGGGQNLAPRQFARPTAPEAKLIRADAAGRAGVPHAHPEKAVIYPRRLRHPWAVLIGGGSFPPLRSLPRKLAARLPRYRPQDDVAVDDEAWCLGSPRDGYLVYAAGGGPLTLDLSGVEGAYRVRWIRPESDGADDEGRGDPRGIPTDAR